MSDHILSGLRVIDCGTYIAGPCAATAMSDFGAEVIKVERPGTGDIYRDLYKAPGMPESEHNYCWIVDARNKKSLTLNLKTEAGQQALHRLVETADIFITNFLPDLVEKFDISYETLKRVNPCLIYGYVTGFGETGPDAGKPAFDQTAFWARSGLMAMVHNADAQPAKAVTGQGDHPTGSALFGAIMMALFNRERTGEGARVSTSLLANGRWANCAFLQAELCGAEFRPKTTPSTNLNPLVNHYLTSDEKRLYMCCMEFPREWHAVCEVIGREDLKDDRRYNTRESRMENNVELIAIIADAIIKEDLAHWAKAFRVHNVTWSPVPMPPDVVSDEQLKAVEALQPIGDDGLKTVLSPIEFEGRPKVAPQMPPELGEHSRELLAELGYDEATIDSLLQ